MPYRHREEQHKRQLAESKQSKSKDTKVCPRCAETVRRAAKVCRFCGNEFTAVTAQSSQQLGQTNKAVDAWLRAQKLAPELAQEPSVTFSEETKRILEKAKSEGYLNEIQGSMIALKGPQGGTSYLYSDADVTSWSERVKLERGRRGSPVSIRQPARNS